MSDSSEIRRVLRQIEEVKKQVDDLERLIKRSTDEIKREIRNYSS